MLDSVFSMLVTGLGRELHTTKPAERVGNRHPETYPVDSFPTKDGDVVLVCFSDATFATLLTAIGRPELVDDPRFLDIQQETDTKTSCARSSPVGRVAKHSKKCSSRCESLESPVHRCGPSET